MDANTYQITDPQELVQVNIHDAKTNLSALLEKQTRQGRSFVIAKSGKPLALVAPFDQGTPATRPNRVGFLKGAFEVPLDFDRMMQDEIISMFEGANE
jgi:antitoxin (DNA-binding transcriptional repressor) of toxin-antitoxin stability system